MDVSRAEQVLGWRPRRSNADALIRTYDWYLANRDRIGAAGLAHRVPWDQRALCQAHILTSDPAGNGPSLPAAAERRQAMSSVAPMLKALAPVLLACSATPGSEGHHRQRHGRDRVRERFPILAETNYLISHSLGLMPTRPAASLVRRMKARHQSVGRGLVGPVDGYRDDRNA